MPKLDIYAVGRGGVNLTKSPIHLNDTELTQAQNAEFDLTEREGGLRKRGGLAAVTSALNSGGDVTGMVGLPLPTTFTRTLYAGLDTTSVTNTWRTTTDGTTWANATTPGRTTDQTKRGTSGVDAYGNRRIIGFKNKFLYPSNDYTLYPNVGHTAPPLRLFDGSSDVELLHVQPGPNTTATANAYAIIDMVAVDGTCYFSCWEQNGGTNGGRVFSLNLTTGLVAQVGDTFGGGSAEISGGMPYTLCSYRGQLYVGLHGVAGGSSGKVVRINPGGTNTWTTDVTGLQGYPISMAAYKGNLYAGLQGDVGENALVVVRTASTGAWTTSDTGSGVIAFSYYGPLIVYEDELYAAFLSPHTTPASVISTIRKFDGSSWTTDLDVKGTLTPTGVTNFAAHRPSQAVIFNGSLFIAYTSSYGNANGFILKNTSGTWSIIEQGKDFNGFMSAIMVQS